METGTFLCGTPYFCMGAYKCIVVVVRMQPVVVVKMQPVTVLICLAQSGCETENVRSTSSHTL